jgi:hypothetical protein
MSHESLSYEHSENFHSVPLHCFGGSGAGLQNSLIKAFPMDKETPRSHTGQSSPRSKAESTRVIPVKPGSDAGLQNLFEQLNPTADRTRLNLFAPDQIDPRTVPRSIPLQRDSQPSRSNEERLDRNYELRAGHTSRNARGFGQSPVSEDSGWHQSKVASESTRSNDKCAPTSPSTASVTSSRPSRCQELHPGDTANNRAARDPNVLEDMAGAPEPGRHEEGQSYNHVSPQHSSCSNQGEVPVLRDVPSGQATQIEGQPESKLAGSIRKSQS